MDFLTKYIPYIILVIGSASGIAYALKPIVEKTKNTFDNKVVDGIIWFAEKVIAVLDFLALNPKPKKDA